MRLEINFKENSKKHMVAKQYATKQPFDYWRNQRRNKKKTPRHKWKWKYNGPKLTGRSKSSSKKEVYSYTILPPKTRKISNKQTNLTPKATIERTNKP